MMARGRESGRFLALPRFSYTNRNTDFMGKFIVRADVNRGVSVPGHQVVAAL